MRPLHPDDWDSSLQHIIETMQGRPLQLHCLLANHPALLNAWWQYRMHSVAGGELSRRDAELVILRVAVHMRAWYEWAAHVVRGQTAGLSMTEINQVASGPSNAGWNSIDQTLLTAVDELVLKHGLSEATRTALSASLSDRQILDVVSLQGMYVSIASLLHSWPLEVEDFVLQRLPPDVTEASFQALLSATDSH